ncbi:HdeD family acid-resistance protein [Actinomadura sp. ATCC 31491]|uniref:HdeD family acid-resistance protein n=1 Tax=Actinomadura luzonensis TaxID=2805427 RepID=A0ABT0GCC9_9ACTN|nr:HdeD family acid-resistance protein [Actinomadura luzonensis]MCK2221895.1 HdeD family acid-resistance protein [Actinomadura luzonensis]
MIDEYLGHWWVLALRGVLALLFGVMAVAWPGITLLVLAVVFGAYAIVDGVLAAVAATRAAKGHRAPLVLLAVAGLLFGVMCLVWPGVTVLVVTLLIGIWAIVTGVAEIVTAVRMRREIQGEWLNIVGGALSVLFGVLVLAWPATGALTVALIIGVYAILAGIVLIVLAFRMRRLRAAGAHTP